MGETWKKYSGKDYNVRVMNNVRGRLAYKVWRLIEPDIIESINQKPLAYKIAVKILGIKK